MRKLLTTEGTHQMKADVTRLHIKRPTGGNGLVQLESIYDNALIRLNEYTEQGKERPTRLLHEYDTRKNKYSPQKEANLIKQKYMTQETAAQNIKNQLKSSTEKEKTEELRRKPMHGQFYWDNERPSVDKEKSKVWLCCSGLKGEIENLIIAAQDKALNTRYH